MPVIERPPGPHRNTASAPSSSTSAKRLFGLGREQHVADHLLAADAARLGGVADLVLDQRRPHVAGADRVAGDVVLGAFERDRLGQADHAVLGGDVGALERRGDQTVGRRDVDDAAEAGLLHRRERGARWCTRPPTG